MIGSVVAFFGKKVYTVTKASPSTRIRRMMTGQAVCQEMYFVIFPNVD